MSSREEEKEGKKKPTTRVHLLIFNMALVNLVARRRKKLWSVCTFSSKSCITIYITTHVDDDDVSARKLVIYIEVS